jgi:hypothetical protein
MMIELQCIFIQDFNQLISKLDYKSKKPLIKIYEIDKQFFSQNNLAKLQLMFASMSSAEFYNHFTSFRAQIFESLLQETKIEVVKLAT